MVPKKAVAEMTPFLMSTIIVIPVSMKGMEKSIAAFRSGPIFRDVMDMSAIPSIKSLTSPFHSVFWKTKQRLSTFNSKSLVHP